MDLAAGPITPKPHTAVAVAIVVSEATALAIVDRAVIAAAAAAAAAADVTVVVTTAGLVIRGSGTENYFPDESRGLARIRDHRWKRLKKTDPMVS